MKCKIIETGEIETLCIRDRETRTEWTEDLIGNAGALNDGQFEWDEDSEAYLVSQDNYDWWKKYIDDYNDTLDEVEELFGSNPGNRHEFLWKLQDEAYGNDYGDHRSNAIRLLSKVREERNEMMNGARSQAASLLGKKGGSVTSERKTASSRENGKKGGRPRKTE